MRPLLRATAIVLSAVVMLFLAAGSIRAVKRHPMGAQFLASAVAWAASARRPSGLTL
jgi:hypothetical protein